MSCSTAQGSQPSCDVTRSNIVKVVLVGSFGVGKTCLVNSYKTTHDTTIGAAFTVRNVHVGDQLVRLHIWDTGGQERYKSLVSLYYRNTQAAIVVYDITDRRTLAAAIRWVDELRLHAPDDVTIVLAGNKLDLAEEDREVDTEDGQDFANASCLKFAEVSAKTGSGVPEMYSYIASTILKKRRIDHRGQGHENIHLAQRDQTRSSCSC